MNITKGIIERPQKVIIYGPEGIGKSSFASRFPSPLFIDTEGSTFRLDVDRLTRPSSWTELMNDVGELILDHQGYKTLVIDTIDWAEMLCINQVCSKHQKKGIEDFGYGRGYVFEKEEFGKLLNRLEELIDSGMNVVLTAHCLIRKFERPDEPPFDRYELKLANKTTAAISAMTKEWADMLLFANYKYNIYEGSDSKKKKASGGKRVMYCTHNPAWDAKNRHGLPDETEFDYKAIATFIPRGIETQKDDLITTASMPEKNNSDTAEIDSFNKEVSIPDSIVPALAKLMKQDNVDELMLRRIVSDKGYFPFTMAVCDYPQDFVEGWVIAWWPKIVEMIRKDENNIPF